MINQFQAEQSVPEVFLPSIFQERIYDTFDTTMSNIIINAVAGSGKSTTIVELAKRIPADKRVVFLAFNRDIVSELKLKLKDFPHIEVKTLHSFGMNELRYRFCRGNNKVDRDKLVDDSKVAKVIVKQAENWTASFLDKDGKLDEAEKNSYCSRVEKIVDIARFALPQSREEMLELCSDFDVTIFNGEIDRAKEVLRECNSINDRFDFVDMVYRPAIGDWQLKQYDVVIVDECQDLNRSQQKMIQKIVRKGGRMIAVGDPYQAIYGFAGADADSYNRLKTLFPNTIELPLSKCYRCPIDVIEHAQQIVPQIEYRDNAPKGEMRQGSVTEIKSGDFVLCRNTRPLVSLCLKFIAKGHKATIKGGDIGKNLIRMINDTKSKSLEAMWNKLDRELEKIIAKARLANPLKEVDEIAVVSNTKDKLEAIRSIQTGFECRVPDDIVTAINSIFTETEDKSGIVFSTIHKSKGLEANNIFMIDKHLMPAKYATRPKDLVQEKNLDYVARTRAKKKYIYVNDWCSDMDKMKELLDVLKPIPANPNPPKAADIADFRRDDAKGKPRRRK